LFGDEKVMLGLASTRKTSLAQARAGHWAALGRQPVSSTEQKERMGEEAGWIG
jgi:hypothetical protein